MFVFLVSLSFDVATLYVVVTLRRNRFWNRVPGCWNWVTRIRFQ